MSKELNIIEAVNMPVGTEFKIIFENGCTDTIILKSIADEKEFVNTSIGNCYALTSAIINSKFIPMQKPVSFKEVVEACGNKKVKVDISKIDFNREIPFYIKKLNNFVRISTILNIISENFCSYEIKLIIQEGKWYIEEY